MTDPLRIARAARAAAKARQAAQLAGAARSAAVSTAVAVTATLRDPAAKLRRRIRRARRGMIFRAVCALGFTVLAAWAYGHDDPLAATFVAVIAVGIWLAALHSARGFWRLRRLPMPKPAPPTPPAGSVAREPLATLAAGERSLANLLVLLGPAAGDTEAEAELAAGVLRERATRIVTLEAARAEAPADARPALDEAVDVGRTQLEDGVAAYERLVSAAATAVAAAGGDPDVALTDHRLREAADALTGLAAGLRALDSRHR